MNNLNETQLLEQLDGTQDSAKIEEIEKAAIAAGHLDVADFAAAKLEALQSQVEASAETTISGGEMTTEEQTAAEYQKEIDTVMAEAKEEIKEIESVPEDKVENVEAVESQQETLNNLLSGLEKQFEGKEANIYTVSEGVLKQVIEDPNYSGGSYKKEIQRSNTEINELNYGSLSEEAYDTLMKAFKIAQESGALQESGPYSGRTGSNEFDIRKLSDTLSTKIEQ